MSRFNITVASWPSTGSTTLGLLLTYLYNLRYFYSGAVFRYFSERLGYTAEGAIYSRNEDKYSDYLDKIVDSYSKVLLDRGSFVVGNKPLGYFTKREDTFEIFLYADLEVRIKRSLIDERESTTTVEESLKIRQKTAGERFKKIYGFDWENIDTLKNTHHLVMDTTKMTVKEELEIIKDEIKKKFGAEPQNEFDFTGLKPNEVKQKAHDLVKENGLELVTEDAVKEMNKLFAEEISTKPEEIQKIFQNA